MEREGASWERKASGGKRAKPRDTGRGVGGGRARVKCLEDPVQEGKDGVSLGKGSPGREEGRSPIRGRPGGSSPEGAPKDCGGWETVPAQPEGQEGEEGAGESGGRPRRGRVGPRGSPRPGNAGAEDRGAGSGAGPGRAGTRGSALRGRGWTSPRGDTRAGGDWGRGMPGQTRPGLGAR